MIKDTNLLSRLSSALLFLPLMFAFVFINWSFFTIIFFLVGSFYLTREFHGFYPEVKGIIKIISFTFIFVTLITQGFSLFQLDNYFLTSTGNFTLLMMSIESIVIVLFFIFFYKEFSVCFTIQQFLLFTFLFITFIFFHILKIKFFFQGSENKDLQYLANFYLCYGFLLGWLYDSAAYLFGKKFGSKKINLKVSPQKSWVGLISGMLSTVVSFGIISFFLKQFSVELWEESFFSQPFLAIGISLFLGIVSQLGDLIASLHKRSLGIKDSGNFLKGHGGFYDRTDSVIWVNFTLYYIMVLYH